MINIQFTSALWRFKWAPLGFLGRKEIDAFLCHGAFLPKGGCREIHLSVDGFWVLRSRFPSVFQGLCQVVSSKNGENTSSCCPWAKSPLDDNNCPDLPSQHILWKSEHTDRVVHVLISTITPKDGTEWHYHTAFKWPH